MNNTYTEDEFMKILNQMNMEKSYKYKETYLGARDKTKPLLMSSN
jgi:hypothetical protein